MRQSALRTTDPRRTSFSTASGWRGAVRLHLGRLRGPPLTLFRGARVRCDLFNPGNRKHLRLRCAVEAQRLALCRIEASILAGIDGYIEADRRVGRHFIAPYLVGYDERQLALPLFAQEIAQRAFGADVEAKAV